MCYIFIILFRIIMAPKVITNDIFKNRKEISDDIYGELIVDGGVEKVKQLLQGKWNYQVDDIVAIPCLAVNNAGKISGAKWHAIGILGREINLKLVQLNSDADEDIFICIKNLDLSIFLSTINVEMSLDG